MDIFARVMVGDFANYSNLIEKTNLNIKDEGGASLLRIAIAYAQPEIALDLVNRGIKIDQPDRKGLTELQNGLVMGYWDVAESLIRRGADVHHRDNYGNNALWYAATHPRPNLDLVRLLADKGCDIDTKNTAGRSTLDALRERGNVELLKILEPSQQSPS